MEIQQAVCMWCIYRFNVIEYAHKSIALILTEAQ